MDERPAAGAGATNVEHVAIRRVDGDGDVVPALPVAGVATAVGETAEQVDRYTGDARPPRGSDVIRITSSRCPSESLDTSA